MPVGTASVYIVGLWERTDLRANQGGHRTPSIFQISPVRVTTYALFPMNSSEVGRSRPSMMAVKVPSPLTLTSEPVFGSAGVAGGLPTGKIPCARA